MREAHGFSGAVASEWLPASLVGLGILREGGNAADAAVAVSLALAVGIPHLGGVGGDYFALARLPGGGYFFVNGSGHAPRRLTRGLLEGMGYSRMPEWGPLSATVPGMIEGLHALWRRLGSMEWRRLVEPAARMAREGFPAPRSLVEYVRASWGRLSRDPGSREAYAPLLEAGPGDKVRFPGLARLLELVAEDPRAFYEGEPAEALESYLGQRGGVMEAGDLRGYSAWVGEPVRSEYRGWRLAEMPPNTQGLTTLHLLKVLEQWSLPRDPLARAPLVVRASPPCYELRDRELGDPRYMRVSVDYLLSEEVVGELRSKASSHMGPPRCGPGPGGDTTFYAVADGEGLLVAGIQSLFYPFGSHVTEPRFQVTLNSRAQGFTLEPGHPNSLEPGKRPLHTLSALVMEGPGDRLVAIGTSGGHYRPQQHALLATSMVDAGMSPGEAVAAPRILWAPGTCSLVVDEGLEARAEELLPGLRARAGRTGVAAIVELDASRGVYTAATDHRGEGYPVTF